MIQRDYLKEWSAKNYKGANIVVLSLFFFLSPILSLPFLWNKLKNRQGYATHFLALFMGFCSILFPPFADLFRHTSVYFDFQSGSGFLLQAALSSDFVLNGLSYLFARSGIHFELIRFLFVFLSYEIFFSVFKYYADRNESLSNDCALYRLALLTVFFLVPFIYISVGLRQSMANAVMLWAYFLIFERDKRYGWLFACLGPCIHFSVLVVACLMIVSRWIKPGKVLTLAGAIFFLFLGYYLRGHSMMGMGDGEIDKNVDYYMNQSVQEFDQTASINGMIAYYLEKLPFFVLLFYTLRSKCSPGYVNNLLLLSLFCFPYSQLFSRIVQISMPVMFFVFIKHNNDLQLRKRALRVIYISSLISFLAFVYGYREPLLHGRYYKLVYPVPVVMDNTYDRQWMMENNTASGGFK